MVRESGAGGGTLLPKPFSFFLRHSKANEIVDTTMPRRNSHLQIASCYSVMEEETEEERTPALWEGPSSSTLMLKARSQHLALWLRDGDEGD